MQGGVGAVEYPRIFVPAVNGGVAPFTDVRADATLYSEYRFTDYFALNGTLRYTTNISDTIIDITPPGRPRKISLPCSGSGSRRTWASASSCDGMRLKVAAITRALVALGLATVGCAGEVGPPTNLPVSSQSTAVGPDDIIGVDVVGEKDLSHEYQVHPDGSIDFEHGVKVDGLEPQEIAATLKKQLVDGKILADPQISIIVKQYNSRKILVVGSVQKPDSITWAPGMTVVGAISLCGWFTRRSRTRGTSRSRAAYRRTRASRPSSASRRSPVTRKKTCASSQATRSTSPRTSSEGRAVRRGGVEVRVQVRAHHATRDDLDHGAERYGQQDAEEAEE